MAEKYKPQVGDRVRVVLEGVVDEPVPDGFMIGGFDDGNYITPDAEHVVSIEKIEPPVEVFKPGDRLRRRTDDGWSTPYEITVADGGYLQHFPDGAVQWHERGPKFTSELFEKVEFVEKPF